MKTPPVSGITSRSSSTTAARHSSDLGRYSDSTLTPKPMWRCSSRETFFIPALKPGIVPSLVKKSSMKCWPGLRERRLDDHVVERDRLAELGQRAVAAQLVGHPVEPVEDLAVAPVELRLGVGEPGGDPVAGADHLAEEAREEDRMARLVDLLRGEEVLLLLERRGVDVGREVVGDRVLAVEEHRVGPQRAAALDLAQPRPALAVLGEVELIGAPVALLPAPVEVRVGDRLHALRSRPVAALRRRVLCAAVVPISNLLRPAPRAAQCLAQPPCRGPRRSLDKPWPSGQGCVTQITHGLCKVIVERPFWWSKVVGNNGYPRLVVTHGTV